MPNYEFQCQTCRKQFQKSLPFGTKDLPPCPVCKGTTKRLISAPMVHFKGTGFYKTDSKPAPVVEKKEATKTPEAKAEPKKNQELRSKN